MLSAQHSVTTAMAEQISQARKPAQTLFTNHRLVLTPCPEYMILISGSATLLTDIPHIILAGQA